MCTIDSKTGLTVNVFFCLAGPINVCPLLKYILIKIALVADFCWLWAVAVSPLTFADARLLVEVVAVRTLALEAAKCVDTVAPLAQPRELLAFIDVCIRKRKRAVVKHTITSLSRQLDLTPGTSRSTHRRGFVLTLKDDGDGIRPETLSSGTESFVLGWKERKFITPLVECDTYQWHPEVPWIKEI